MLSESARQLVTAYVDGELNARQRRQAVRLLSRSEEARRLLNRLEEDAVAQVEVGMSQSAVQFLLGTPMLADPFHADRWDYPYYLRRGRSEVADQSWVVIYFEDGRVTRVERDVTLDPSS